jgi:hypothetical protein
MDWSQYICKAPDERNEEITSLHRPTAIVKVYVALQRRYTRLVEYCEGKR